MAPSLVRRSIIAKEVCDIITIHAKGALFLQESFDIFGIGLHRNCKEYSQKFTETIQLKLKTVLKTSYGRQDFYKAQGFLPFFNFLLKNSLS
jgi:hypothetical protein